MAANSQELKYVFAQLLLLLKVFSRWTRQLVFCFFSAQVNVLLFLCFLVAFLFPPHIMHGFCALHIKLFGIFTIFLQIGMNPRLCSQSCCKKHLVSVSLNLQVPNTWLWWIWTCDWELCFAQKVAERERERKNTQHNWAWNTFVRCMTFRQMVKVSLYAANMLHFLNLCVYWFFWLLVLSIYAFMCRYKTHVMCEETWWIIFVGVYRLRCAKLYSRLWFSCS